MRGVGLVPIGAMLTVAVGGCGLRLGPMDGGGPGVPTVGPGTSRDATAAASDAGLGSEGDRMGCGPHEYDIRYLPANVLIVQDRSGSMANDFANQSNCAGATCKWAAVTNALESLVSNSEATTNWGITFFPSGTAGGDSNCAVSDSAAVAPGAPNGAAIADSIAMTSPSGQQPTRAAVAAAADYLNALATDGPKFIVLATDGQPSCPDGGDGADEGGALASVAAAFASGIPVFVVGIGNVAAAESTLNSLAMAGGVPQVTPDVDPATGIGRLYYPADDPALQAKLSVIGAQSLSSCTFQLAELPFDPTNIAVLIDNKAVPKDPTNGWSYGPGFTSIILYGTSCAELQTRANHQVTTIFGCGDLIIIP